MTSPDVTAAAPLVVASMIVKNEAHNLPDLFASAAGLVDVWAIVDTGSTDLTVNVARTLGVEHGVPVHVIEDAWDDDFARSRNVGLDFIDGLYGDDTAAASNPWILILDGDDRLQTPAELRGLLEEDAPDVDCILLPVVSAVGGGRHESTLQPRLFRRSAGIRYKYPAHLMADFTPEHRVGGFEDTVIRHGGYTEGGKGRNAERTLRIVRAKMPEGHPHRTYVEGRALLTLERWDEARTVATNGIMRHHAVTRAWRAGERVHEDKGYLPNINPWVVLGRTRLIAGEDVGAVGALADGLNQGVEYAASPDAWYALLTAAALGLYVRAQTIAEGGPGTSGVMDAVPGVLTALIRSRVLGAGLDLSDLRDHAARLRGVGTRSWEEDWPAKGAGIRGAMAPASYYDGIYASASAYAEDPDPARHGAWFRVWEWAAAHINKGQDRVLDLGCGPGHLAALLVSEGLDPSRYLGVDFSPTAVALARAAVPGAEFRVAELPQALAGLIEEFQPTVVTALEVIEHVPNATERAILGTGLKTVVTCPRRDDASHLRFFPAQEEAEDHYGGSVEPVGNAHWGFVTEPGTGLVSKADRVRRILVVAPSDVAGQGSGVARALRDHGEAEVMLLLYRRHPFGYPVPEGSVVIEDGVEAGMVKGLAEWADFYHFLLPPEDTGGVRWADYAHAGNSLVQYMGSMLRSERANLTAWHEHTGILGLGAWDPTMIEGTSMPYHVPLVLVDRPEHARVWRREGPFRIAHATTNRAFKGTQTFLDVVAELRAEGHEIETEIIEGVSNDECLRIKATCHAYFDQFSVGIYGMSAIESMAMGQPVLTGTSAWARSVQPDMPVIDVTPETLGAVLKKLILDPRGAWGRAHLRSKRWAIHTHGAEPIARRLLALYRHVAQERSDL